MPKSAQSSTKSSAQSPKNVQKQLETYYQKLKVFHAFQSAESLLSWDRETWMPEGAAADRGQTLSVLAGFLHELFTDKEFVKLVDSLHSQLDDLDPIGRRSVVVMKKDLDKTTKLSTEFVEETESLFSTAHTAWFEAKKTSNFALYEPHLEKIVENRKKYAALLNPHKNAYDVQLDDYEEGLTIAQLDPMFAHLRKGLKELLPKVLEKQELEKKKLGEPKNPLDDESFDPQLLQKFLREMAAEIGFDWKRGAMGTVEHPFETAISPNDVRVNTHSEKLHHSSMITGMIHELGHGMYEQNSDPKYIHGGLHHGTSLGIHESQSRLLENIIGRSPAFWTHFLPKLQSLFPQLKSARVEEVVRALNTVKPSLIRTEADEVTYNLHVIVRFEIEKGLLLGEMKVKDLPEIWKAKMQELLGVQPSEDSDGPLQDIHWSWGNFGYFPTYTLGNLNAAQLWNAFLKENPNWESEVKQGNFTSYVAWFQMHVWQHGSFLMPDEVMKQATGESTNAEYFLKYLNEKYLGE